MTSLPPNVRWTGDTGGMVTLYSVELTWSQWTCALTHNIVTRHVREVHLVNINTNDDSDEAVEDMKIPYQIFGESLSTVTVLTLKGYRVSAQQVLNMQGVLKLN